MNPFEYFLDRKLEIEADQGVMKIVRDYAFEDPLRLQLDGLLTAAGDQGEYNSHFRLGRVGDLWLATREFTHPIWGVDAYVRKGFYENYIRQLVEAYDQIRSGELTGRVPLLCEGVIAIDKGGLERSFLILEDLYRGGTSDFVPGPEGKLSGTLDGEEVMHDFEDRMLVGEFQHMVKDLSIFLQE